MKKDIHPKYEEVTASCSCGNVMKIRSTVGHDLNLDVRGEEKQKLEIDALLKVFNEISVECGN